MSDPTPRPERVTLSDEEVEALQGETGNSGHYIKGILAPAVERILAAREQALREEIAGQIEAHGAWWDHSPDWRGGVDEAADIARGTVR